MIIYLECSFLFGLNIGKTYKIVFCYVFVGVKKKLEEIILIGGIVMGNQVAMANDLSRDAGHLSEINLESNCLEYETFYNNLNGDNLYLSYLDKSKEVFSKEYFEFERGGDSIKDIQKLEWFARYGGRLPLNASLNFFGGIDKKGNIGGDIENGEASVRIPLGGKDSHVFLEYSRAWVPTGKMKLRNSYIFQLGLKFKF